MVTGEAFLILVFLLNQFAAKVTAYANCTTRFENLTLICRDTYSSTGYCCNFHEDHYHGCCFTVPVYLLWYFWMGIFCGIFLIVAGVYAYCKRYKRKNLLRSSTHTAERNSAPVVRWKNDSVTLHLDYLPTYEEVQAQAIGSQNEAFANYKPNAYNNKIPIDDGPTSNAASSFD